MVVAIVTLFWSRGYDIVSVRDHLLPMVDQKKGLEASLPKSEPAAGDVWKTQVAQWVNGVPTEHFQGMPMFSLVTASY